MKIAENKKILSGRKFVSNAGFTLLISIITTSMLLIVSFVVVNVSLGQLLLASAAHESQYAFYAADGGTECAVYWDLKDPSLSAFDTSTPGTITCSGQTIGVGNPDTVNTIPSQSAVIGGATPSIFEIDFTKGCAIVRVTKSGGVTTIDSRGYNTCDTSAQRRYERGVTLVY
ncbi:MAG TPA: pilus assembly PilX N-terminal domain-containing protein [Candidatus Paceibacterota bacterium]